MPNDNPTNLDRIQRHNQDVIFYKDSLEEFIRLIQRQGINNLTIYSVSDLLAGSGDSNTPKFQTIKTRSAPPTMPFSPLEFELDELKDRKGYFVFVRYSFCWEGSQTQNGAGGKPYGSSEGEHAGEYGYYNENHVWVKSNNQNGSQGEYHSLNQLNGRHVFIKTVNDIIIYKNNNKKYTISNKTNITDEDLLDGKDKNGAESNITSADLTNGTFVMTVDNTQYVVKIRGFDTNGNYLGKVMINSNSNEKDPDNNKVANNTDGYVLRGDGAWANRIDNDWLPVENNKSSLGRANLAWKNLYISTSALPSVSATSATGNGADLGASDNRWRNIYGYSGNFTELKINNTTINPTKLDSVVNAKSDTAHFWRGDSNWSNELTGTLILSATIDAEETQNKNVALVIGTRTGQHLELDGNEILSKENASTRGTLWLNGSKAYYETINNETKAVFSSTRVYKAVYNDSAECRKTIDLPPGYVVIDNDDGSLSCASQRLQPGGSVISDTYGDLMGETEDCKTPVAIAGRVLVYTYQPRENYHAGMAVCSAPNGTVDIMTREEIKEYPDCIIGIVSEIPQYERWGTDNVLVNGRIWIKVK